MNYLKIYYDLMESRKKFTSFSSNLDFYYEKHHIVPRCMAGPTIPENLVLLTAREHFIAHRLLVKAYPNCSGLIDGFIMMRMNKNVRRLTSRQYERIKSSKRIITEETREKLSKALLGIPLSKERRENISIACKDPMRSKKISDSKLGKPLSEEHKRKMSEAQKGKIRIIIPETGKMGHCNLDDERLISGEFIKFEMSDEQKEKISKSNKKEKSNSHKESISNAQRGKLRAIDQNTGQMHWYNKNDERFITGEIVKYTMSDEQKEAISKAITGRKMSEESKQKMREAKLGKKLSEETKQKMSESQKNRNNKTAKFDRDDDE